MRSWALPSHAATVTQKNAPPPPTPQPEPKVLRKSDSFKMEKRLDLQIEEPTAQVTRAVGEPPAPEPLETPTAAEVERTLEAGV